MKQVHFSLPLFMLNILKKIPFDKILDFLQPLVIPIIIGAVYVLTHTIWEAFFTVSVVDFIFSHIEKNILNDSILITTAFVFVIWLIYKLLYKKHKPPLRLLSFIFIITAIYSYYRFLGSVWYFTSFSFSENVKYADVLFTTILIIPLLVIQLYLKATRKTDNQADNNLTTGFLYDEPISREENQDKFGYEFYAKTIAEKLMATHSKEDKAFAMGINGKWGSGKTSFVTLIKKYLIKDHFIEIEFNPWNSHTPKAIIEDFFDTLEEGLMNHHWGTAKLIRSYSKKLIELNDSALTRGIQLSSSYLFGDGSLGSIQQKIKESQLFDKKIIVYIDDLDRLDQSEIIEVMRLIRNTANFKNMFFVVCYDRNYILNALKDLNIQHERFLEKIFQLEVTLPYLESRKLRNYLFEGLKKNYPEEYHKIIKNTIVSGMGLHNQFQKILDKWVLNLRDITLIINSLSLNSSNLLGDFYFPDLLKLELLRVR